jgi:hypothetical protein
VITPGEAATIAAVVDTFVRAIETSDFERRLRLVEADHFNQPACTCWRGWVPLQPIGENLLQIRCGWRDVQSLTQLMIVTCRPQKEPSLRGAAGDEAISMIGRVSCPRLPRYARNDTKGDIAVIAKSCGRRRNLSGSRCAGDRPPGNWRCSRSAARAARSRPSPRGFWRRPGSPVGPSLAPGRG